MIGIFELLICILLMSWLLGLTVFGIGELIHVILVLAIIIFVFRLATGAYSGPRGGGL